MVEIQQGLLITAIGMGLVFVVIILLWGLMALLMRVTSKSSPNEESAEEKLMTDPPHVPDIEKDQRKRRAGAAAVAVNIALADMHKSTAQKVLSLQRGRISPWQTVHRLRQLERRKR